MENNFKIHLKILPLLLILVVSILSSCKQSPPQGNSKNTTTTVITPVTGTSITLQSPLTSPNNDSTPTFLISGVVPNTTVKLFTNSLCTQEVGRAYANNTGVVITSTSLSLGTYNFYTKSFNSEGTSSVCSSALATYTYKIAPFNLTYSSNPITYEINSAITNNVPTYGGNAATSFSISQALPLGLFFDTATGIISGTPTALSPATNYIVTATNAGGSTITTLSLRVAGTGAPTALTYTTSSATYTSGTAITNNTPSYSGGAVTSFSIAPALPTGLSLNTTTGVISGTPTVVSGATNYTITAQNASGSTTATIAITVLVAAPTAITYSANPATYTNGTAITNNVAVVSGGAVSSFSISPALPLGLNFDTGTGIISGTPTITTSATNYTITGTNVSGSISTTLSITVANAGVTPLTASSMTRLSPTTSPNNIATPSFTLNGLAADTTAKLYTGSDCTSEVGSAYVTGTSVVITTSVLPLGSYNFFTRSFNSSGQSSPCSGLMLSYTYGHLIDATFTYDFVPSSSGKLDYANKTQKPLRQVYVELKKASDGSVISTFNTDNNGNIKYYLPRNDSVYFDISAEIKSPSVIIQDNTNGFVKYVVGTSAFTVNGNIVINKYLPCGWSGTNAAGSYTGTRVAAPFAILDSIYSSIKKIKDARPSVSFPALSVAWSVNNVAVSGSVSAGEIGTSSYWPSQSRIYILGKADADTDEFDRHVVAHEWGHYFEDKLSRANNIAGTHGPGDISDMTLAWGEGWPNAFSAIVFDPDITYVDTAGTRQQSGWSFSLETGTDTNPGWFSEVSIQQLFYDLYDSGTNENYDSIALGIGPLYDVMVGAQKTTTAMTSVFSFIDGLKTANPSIASNIDTLVSHYSISPVTDKYGSTESHNAGFASNLPLYNTMTLGGSPVSLHLYGYSDGGTTGEANSAYNNKYIKFTATSSLTRFQVSSTDSFTIYIYENGSYYTWKGADRTSALSFGPFTYDVTTVAGKNYVLRVNTDKNSVYFQNPVDINITGTAIP